MSKRMLLRESESERTHEKNKGQRNGFQKSVLQRRANSKKHDNNRYHGKEKEKKSFFLLRLFFRRLRRLLANCVLVLSIATTSNLFRGCDIIWPHINAALWHISCERFLDGIAESTMHSRLDTFRSVFQRILSVHLRGSNCSHSTITEYEDNKGRKSTGTENGRCSVLNQPSKEHIPAVQPLIWRNIIGIASLHVVAIYMFATRYHEAKFWTWMWGAVYAYTAGVGVTAGAHRLWAHRSYKAKLPLKILLAYLYCMAGQTHLSKWIRVHRTHHKFTDMSADPHNSNRGFFFSHVGWLMMKHHPDVKKYGRVVDMSDIAADPVIRFADKYYPPIILFAAFVLPVLVPVYVWNETWDVSIGSIIVRYVLLLNATFIVNSVAHIWGHRPYNKTIKPTQNPTVSFFALGEGWHNYHHCFPWDYKAAELPLYRLNLATAFIDFMAWVGWDDLKTVNSEFIDRYSINHGDKTHGDKN